MARRFNITCSTFEVTRALSSVSSSRPVRREDSACACCGVQGAPLVQGLPLSRIPAMAPHHGKKAARKGGKGATPAAAAAPADVKKVDMSGLYCPFTPRGELCAPVSRVLCSEIEEALPYSSPTPWHAVVNKIVVAYSLFSRGFHAEGRSYVVAALMHLLPPPLSPHPPCAMIAEYSVALRHVLDSCWALMGYSDDREDPYVRSCIAGITPYQKLAKKQVAALHAIQSRCNANRESEEALLLASVSLSPAEGEWRLMLALAMESKRTGLLTRSASTNKIEAEEEELEHLREAYRLRPHPRSMLKLAGALASSSTRKKQRCEEALRLVEEALDLYPDQPYVLEHAAFVQLEARGDSTEALERAVELVRRAAALAGDRAYLRLRLGGLCRRMGLKAEAAEHYRAARELNPIGAQVYTDLFLTGGAEDYD